MHIENEDLLKCELKRFGLKENTDHSQDIISRTQYRKIKDFTANPDVTVRKSDKSIIFVTLKTADY